MADHYEMLEQLGSGSFGVVYKARDRRTNELVAIKLIDLEGSDDDIVEIQQEISVLSSCSSPYVTEYKASFVRGVKLWIVMEYLGGGSCNDLLKPGSFHESQVAIVMRELLYALDYLHQTGKIHRDIKAANVLLAQSGKVKMADFGVAAQLSNIRSQRMTFVGTPYWMAPEVINDAAEYNFKADIWSLGITAMELAAGDPPLSHIHPMKVLLLIPKQAPPKLEGGYSTEFKDFVAKCLQMDPDKRPTAKELLRHKFVRNAGKVEQLRELVRRHERWASRDEKPSHPKYYEETMQNLSPRLEQDEWVFDTIKPATVAQPKRRKMSRIPSDASDVTNPYATIEARKAPEPELQKMELDAAPLGTGSIANGYPTMMRRPHRTSSSRKSSAGTAMRVPSGQTPRSRKTSRTDSSLQKQPLGLDMSFGNSPSTTRQFRRVSSGGHEKRPGQERDVPGIVLPEQRMGLNREKSASNASTLVGADENTPPVLSFEDKFKEIPIPVKPIQVTKESLLGRRAYSKVIDNTFQAAYAQTAEQDKREALSRLHNAWTVLDRVDPEGEFLLLKTLIENLREDSRMSAALGLTPLANAQPSTPIASPTKQSPTKPSAGGFQPSPSKPTFAVPSKPATPRHRQTQSVSNIDVNAVKSPRGMESPSKQQPRLILAQNNPHLKSHRRRQSALVDNDMLHMYNSELDEKRLPGFVPQGMEQAGALTDVLYARWLDGLKSRWGMN